MPIYTRDEKIILAIGAMKRPAPVDGENGDSSKRVATTSRRCGVCGETGHNARTCSKDRE